MITERDWENIKQTARREGREEGRIEGREEGHREGLEEGRAEGRADSILTLLEDKGEIPKSLREKIKTEKDMETLGVLPPRAVERALDTEKTLWYH